MWRGNAGRLSAPMMDVVLVHGNPQVVFVPGGIWNHARAVCLASLLLDLGCEVLSNRARVRPDRLDRLPQVVLGAAELT